MCLRWYFKPYCDENTRAHTVHVRACVLQTPILRWFARPRALMKVRAQSMHVVSLWDCACRMYSERNAKITRQTRHSKYPCSVFAGAGFGTGGGGARLQVWRRNAWMLMLMMRHCMQRTQPVARSRMALCACCSFSSVRMDVKWYRNMWPTADSGVVHVLEHTWHRSALERKPRLLNMCM